MGDTYERSRIAGSTDSVGHRRIVAQDKKAIKKKTSVLEHALTNSERQNMTRRDWWLGVALILVALVGHAVFPRYDVRYIDGAGMVRIDTWTGTFARVYVAR
jgi:hypothetical protein